MTELEYEYISDYLWYLLHIYLHILILQVVLEVLVILNVYKAFTALPIYNQKKSSNSLHPIPHVKDKTRSTTSEILSIPRILGKTSYKKKGEVKKI